MGTSDLRRRQSNHRLRDREARGRKRDLGQVQRVQRDRHRVHRSSSDRTRRLRIPNIRGERRRKVGAELLHHTGQDLRGGGRRETGIRQNSTDQHQRAPRQNIRPRMRGDRETVAHRKVRLPFNHFPRFLSTL